MWLSSEELERQREEELDVYSSSSVDILIDGFISSQKDNLPLRLQSQLRTFAETIRSFSASRFSSLAGYGSANAETVPFSRCSERRCAMSPCY